MGGGDHEATPGPMSFHQFGEHRLRGRIKGCGGLVQEPERPGADEEPRQGHTPPLSRGEIGHRQIVGVTEAEPLAKRLRDIRKTPQEALEAGVLSDAEYAKLREVEEAVQRVVAVDDYTPEELTRLFPDMRRPDNWGGNKEAAE